MFRRCFQNKGMSFVEIVTVLAIVGICLGFFYTVFFSNWRAFEIFTTQADMAQELNQMIDGISTDGRQAHQYSVSKTTTSQIMTFLNNDVNLPQPENVVYTINNTGQFTVSRNQGTPVIIADNVDFIHSSFNYTDGTSFIEVNLALSQQIFGLVVNQSSSVEIYPRD